MQRGGDVAHPQPLLGAAGEAEHEVGDLRGKPGRLLDPSPDPLGQREEGLPEQADGLPARVFPEAFDGTYLAITPECKVVEGEAFVASLVVIEFPSVERAREWHPSAEYAPWKAMRQLAVTNSAVIFGGWAPPPR